MRPVIPFSQLKKQTTALKKRSLELQHQIEKLEGSVGLFTQKDLLKDYYLCSG